MNRDITCSVATDFLPSGHDSPNVNELQNTDDINECETGQIIISVIVVVIIVVVVIIIIIVCIVRTRLVVSLSFMLIAIIVTFIGVICLFPLFHHGFFLIGAICGFIGG